MVQSMQHTLTHLVPNPQNYEEELDNIYMAVNAMLTDSYSGRITAGYGIPNNDTDNVTTDSGTRFLNVYLTGLNPDGAVKSGCRYIFTIDGTVIQVIP